MSPSRVWIKGSSVKRSSIRWRFMRTGARQKSKPRVASHHMRSAEERIHATLGDLDPVPRQRRHDRALHGSPRFFLEYRGLEPTDLLDLLAASAIPACP